MKQHDSVTKKFAQVAQNDILAVVFIIERWIDKYKDINKDDLFVMMDKN